MVFSPITLIILSFFIKSAYSARGYVGNIKKWYERRSSSDSFSDSNSLSFSDSEDSKSSSKRKSGEFVFRRPGRRRSSRSYSPKFSRRSSRSSKSHRSRRRDFEDFEDFEKKERENMRDYAKWVKKNFEYYNKLIEKAEGLLKNFIKKKLVPKVTLVSLNSGRELKENEIYTPLPKLVTDLDEILKILKNKEDYDVIVKVGCENAKEKNRYERDN